MSTGKPATEPVVVDAVHLVGVTIEPSPGGGPEDVTLNLVVALPPEQMAELGLDYGDTIAPQPAARATSDSSPVSDWLVAPVIVTGTISPGEASPSKLTTLLCEVRPRRRDGSWRE